MLVLVTYDVNTETAAGRKRLRKVAKSCVDYGQRVQNSVFECLLDAAQYAAFKAKLAALIDPDTDSLRFYQLGNNYKSKVEHIGHTVFKAAQDEYGHAEKEPQIFPQFMGIALEAIHSQKNQQVAEHGQEKDGQQAV